MSMSFDPEAIYQDADIEQAQFEAEGDRYWTLRAKGICTHSGRISASSSGKIHYPIQEKLEAGEWYCTDGCRRIYSEESPPNFDVGKDLDSLDDDPVTKYVG